MMVFQLMRVGGRRSWRRLSSVYTSLGHQHSLAKSSLARAKKEPPLLTEMKADLKAAMRAKDANRLSVLRSVMAEITNASKSPKPIQTDIELLSLLQKRAREAKAAAVEFDLADRKEMQEKEIAQSEIFEEYAARVDVVGDDEMRQAIADGVPVLSEKRHTPAKGTDLAIMLRYLVGPQGILSGKPVDRARLTELARVKLGEF